MAVFSLFTQTKAHLLIKMEHDKLIALERIDVMPKKINSEMIYRGKFFHLTKDKIEVQHDQVTTQEMIHHPGGCAILVQKDHEVLLISQYRYAVDEILYEIPAGKIEKNEHPHETAMRELEEESGYNCLDLQLIMTMYPTPGFCNEKIYIYEANGLFLPQQRRAMDEDECIETHWISLDQTYEWIKEGKIKDAKTIIALQYAFVKRLKP